MMTSTDSIADFLTRIRNAIHAKHRRIDVPSSRMKLEIARILQEHRYIISYSEIPNSIPRTLRIALRYTPDGVSAITGIKRISKPGRRIYADVDSLPRVLNGLGIAIISTSKGILTDKQARELRVGGEVICYVW